MNEQKRGERGERGERTSGDSETKNSNTPCII